MIFLVMITGFSVSGLASSEKTIPRALNQRALITDKGTQSALFSVARAGTRLVLAGERGLILTSDDHGESWQQSVVPTSVNLVTLRFINAQEGWAVGHMGVILHTIDGARTWHKQLDGVQAAKLAMEAVQNSHDDRLIREAQYLLDDGPDKPFFDISVDERGHGYVIGAFNMIFRTDDGGQHWRYWSPYVENSNGLHLYAIQRVADHYLIVGEQGLMLRSMPENEHFTAINSPYNGSWFGLLVTRNNTLLAYGLRGNAYVSHDLGATWISAQVHSDATFSSATELLNGQIILANQAGELFTSDDHCKSFRPFNQRMGMPLTDVVQNEPGDLVLTSLRGVKRESERIIP